LLAVILAKYFTNSIIFAVLGLIGAFFLGQYITGTTTGGIEAVFLTAILSILEISLSFDNAVVNAIILKKMTSIWQKRFLTWGMLTAVFGMRFLFPLAIVSIIAKINPWSSLVLAATKPQEYADLMLSAHVSVSAFGGIFLLMVAFKYFFDYGKEEHWLPWFEKPMSRLGKLEAVETAVSLVVLVGISLRLPAEEQATFLFSGIAGIIVFLLVDALGTVLADFGEKTGDLHKASLGMFLYLQVLDSSFSFDGVVGAFAITNNLFIILIGLSVGAFFVRSLTIMFVEKNTLDGFQYLEHGAFYAVMTLAASMLSSVFVEIPEWVTALSGAVIIALAVFSSIVQARKAS
jgi:hypothetical protein